MGNKQSEETLARSLCWHCESEVGGTYFCEQCVKIQPITPEADHFSRLGLSRQLQIDSQDLERRFYERSRKFHPDFFQQKSPEERDISLQNSALLNSAYRTLRDPFRRVEYLIRLEEGAAREIPAKAPPELLEEVMDLQERLESFREDGPSGSPADREKILSEEKKLRARLEGLEKALFDLFETWDRLTETSPGDKGKRKDTLVRMRDILSERTYITNLIETIGTTLSGAGNRA